jgi:hypothetical protein
MKIYLFKTIPFIFSLLLMPQFVLAEDVIESDSNPIVKTSIEDIMSVNLVMMAMAQDGLEQLSAKIPCAQKENEILLEKKIKSKPKSEAECDCKKSKLVGNIKEQEISWNHGNDNFLHGLLTKSVSYINRHNGDDLDRTFSMGFDYTMKGDKGVFKLSTDSSGFSKYTKKDGSYYDQNNYHYLIFHELNTIDAKYDQYTATSDHLKKYKIFELKFENETDNGHLSRSIQNMWHHSLKSSDGSHPRYYHYLTEKDDVNTLKAYMGIGAELSSNLNFLECDSKVEGKVGLSYNTNAKGAFGIRGETKIKATAVPFLVMSIWGSVERDFRGNSHEGGAELSFPMKFKTLTIKPYLGVEKHNSTLDKEYGVTSQDPYEKYYSFGVRVKW